MKFLFVFCAIIATSHLDATIRSNEWIPQSQAREICLDTPLTITFTETPHLGKTGSIRIHRTADHAVVDTIDLSRCSENGTETRSIAGTKYQVYPILIDGKTASIFPHAGVLQAGTGYYITVDSGVFIGFAGISSAQGWRFETKKRLPDSAAETLRVEADGSGDFCTVQAAIDFIPRDNRVARKLVIGKGIYREIVRIDKKPMLRITGSGRDQTIITYANNNRLNDGTNQRILFHVGASDVTLTDLSLVNSTPQGGSQAEALRVNSQRFIMRNCRLHSYQDTLLIHGENDSAYFRDCSIAGQVDFIWGSGRAVFDRCEIQSLASGYICQMRTPIGQVGAIFWDCRFTRAANVKNVYLARIDANEYPHSHVSLLDCQLDAHVTAAAWLNTAKNSEGARRLSFLEYRSKNLDGKWSDVSGREKFSRQLQADEAKKLRDFSVIWGDWNPAKSN